MSSPRRQAGLAAAAIVILLVLGLVAVILGTRSFNAALGLDQREATIANMRLISAALAGYASLNQRLPCPAAGTSDAGAEDPAGPAATCNSPDGVVPWAALALRREDIVDGWGRKISYRVYDGPTGLTQAGGASMADCNTDASATSMTLDNGKCPTNHFTGPAAFLAGKGLSVQTDSGTAGGYAFALISHGETGVRAFAAEGGGRVAAPDGVTFDSTFREYRNTQAGTTFDNRSRSAPGVLPTSTNYFDDTVVAVKIGDLVGEARLIARAWGDISGPLLSASTGAASTFNRTDVEAALGGSTSFNTGQNPVSFGTFTATASGSTGRNVSSGIGTSGEGIGSIGTGSTTASAATINSATGESLSLRFTASDLRYLGITLVDFGMFGGGTGTERARFRFLLAGSQVAQIDKSACAAGNVKANFLLDPGTVFDEVVVSARTTTTGSNSTLLVGGLRACTSLLGSNSCTAAGAVAGDNCP